MTPLLRALALSLFALVALPGSEDVAESESNLAELPYWPIAMMVPEEGFGTRRRQRGPPKAEVLIWIPSDDRPIRSLLLVPNNSDSKHVAEHEQLRAVATKHDLAIVYLRRTVHGAMKDGADLTVVPRLLEVIATHTGRPEFRHAPWVVFGKSSTGMHPYWMAWAHPQRTIAAICYHGEVPHWPLPAWANPAALEATIPYVVINGEIEWMGTWYRHVRPNFLNYRAGSRWLPHQVVVAGVDHGNYFDGHGTPNFGKPVPAGQISTLRVWDYIAITLDKALSARLPVDGDTTTGPLSLRTIDPDSGVLLHPRAPEVILGLRPRPIREVDGRFTIIDHRAEPHEVYDEQPEALDRALMIRPATEVPEAERARHFWLFDQEHADAWLALHTVAE